MKMHRFEIYVPDFEDSGIDNVLFELDNIPHFMVIPMLAQTADVGAWDDKHELNNRNTPIEEFRKYFTDEKCVTKFLGIGK